MSKKSGATVATMGIDIGKNSFHIVGLDRRGAIVVRQTWSRDQIEARFAVMPLCLLSPRMMRLIEDLAGDWRRLDERIEGLSTDIANVVAQDPACERLMKAPGIGPHTVLTALGRRRTMLSDAMSTQRK
jgi:transposase